MFSFTSHDMAFLKKSNDNVIQRLSVSTFFYQNFFIFFSGGLFFTYAVHLSHRSKNTDLIFWSHLPALEVDFITAIFVSLTFITPNGSRASPHSRSKPSK